MLKLTMLAAIVLVATAAHAEADHAKLLRRAR
jgi:hypothetical protein